MFHFISSRIQTLRVHNKLVCKSVPLVLHFWKLSLCKILKCCVSFSNFLYNFEISLLHLPISFSFISHGTFLFFLWYLFYSTTEDLSGNQKLNVSVWDDLQRENKDHYFLGHFQLSLNDIISKKKMDRWFSLLPKPGRLIHGFLFIFPKINRLHQFAVRMRIYISACWFFPYSDHWSNI